MLAIYLSRQAAQMTHQKIAEYFLLNRRSIGTIIARSEERIEKDEKFRKLFRLLDVLINS